MPGFAWVRPVTAHTCPGPMTSVRVYFAPEYSRSWFAFSAHGSPSASPVSRAFTFSSPPVTRSHVRRVPCSSCDTLNTLAPKACSAGAARVQRSSPSRSASTPSRRSAAPNQHGKTCRRATAGMMSASVKVPASSIFSISCSSHSASASLRAAGSAPKSTKPSPRRWFSWVSSCSRVMPGKSILFTNTKVGTWYRRSSRHSVSVWLCTPSVPLTTSTA